MKKILLISINLFIAINLNSQITDFWGIKFGSSIDDARKIMLTKNINEDFCTKDALYYKSDYNNPSYFAKHFIKGLTLSFHNGKFYSAYINLEDSDSHTLNSFNELEKLLIKKYGKPTSYLNDYDFHNFKRVWKDGKATITLQRFQTTRMLSLKYNYQIEIDTFDQDKYDDL